MAIHRTHFVCAILVLGVISPGCHPLAPKRIAMNQMNIAPEIRAATTTQFERGKRRPVIDTIGWVVGIPSKIILWNRRVENHRVSEETEAVMAEYLASNGLDHVKVRVNQYRPLDDWYRLTQNKHIAWPWRYTFGAVNVLGETVFPGRIFGGDHYNPFTSTIHLYSDVPVIALHEAGHAKDFARRTYPGTYAAAYVLPGAPLYHESVASRDVMAYLEELGDTRLQRQAYYVLYPAYGTYGGDAAGFLFPRFATPIYYGGVLVGHLAGRLESRKLVDRPDGIGQRGAVGSGSYIETTPTYSAEYSAESPMVEPVDVIRR